MKTINFIIPCYNEEGNIELFMKDAEKHLFDLKYEFYFTFVNDGSKDLTKEKVLQLDYQNIILIDFSKNFGKESAMLAGLDNSLQYDATIIIDADLQMPLTCAVEMIEEWEKGNKFIRSYRSNREKGLKNNIAAKFYDVFNKFGDTEIKNDALDFQLMDKQVVEKFVLYREKNRFLKGITGLVGFESVTIPVEFDERQHGTSSFGSFKKLVSYAINGLTAHSLSLLKFIIYFGVVAVILSLMYTIYIVTDKLFFSQDSSEGWTSLAAISSLSFSFIIMTLGIIGHYIGMIYEEVKQRPHYIIDEIYSKNKK